MNIRKNNLKNAESFIVYYGTGETEKLKKYDLVIVEPQGQSRESIQEIQLTGKLVIAYVSAMEVHNGMSEFRLLREEDFLKINGSKLLNNNFSTSMVDLRSRRWRTILIHHIGDLLYNYNYDGIFIDTLANIEYPNIPSIDKEQLVSVAINLIKDIRGLFNEHLIIINNGVEKLLPYITGIVDAICWENPPIDEKVSKKWVNAVIKELSYIKQNKDIKILVLFDHVNLSINKIITIKDLSNSNGFLLYFAMNGYTKL